MWKVYLKDFGEFRFNKKEVTLTGKWKTVHNNGSVYCCFEAFSTTWLMRKLFNKKFWIYEGWIDIEWYEEIINDCRR